MANQCNQGVAVSYVNAATIQIYATLPQGFVKIANIIPLETAVKDVEMGGMEMPFYVLAKVRNKLSVVLSH